MRKKTIFYYEFKRLVRSRTHVLLLAVLLVYCVFLLRSTVIFGTVYTAPYSLWTFCAYISSLSPILFVLLLSLCARQYAPTECRTMTILSATPMPIRTYKLLRYSAVACVFLIAAALSMSICFIFYWLVFDYTFFSLLLWSGVLLLLPPAFLLLGGATLLGSRRPSMIYVLLAAILIVGVFQVPLPECIDIIGRSVNLPLYAGEHNFAFAPAFILGRIAFLVTGIAFIAVSLMLPRKQSSR